MLAFFINLISTDLAKSIINDMLKIELRAQEMKLFQAMGGLGGLFGFGGSSDVSGISTAQWQSGAFASGGTFGGGTPMLVGENGPELFIPPSAGSIVPNNSMGNMASASSVVYNISAVDARSFQQLVASDPQFIYAVTEQGRLSLPATRR